MVKILSAGVKGLFSVEIGAKKLKRALKLVGKDGLTVMDCKSFSILMKYYDSLSQPAFNVSLKEEGLTRREKEVLLQVAEGRSNHDIAESLDLSIKTVKNYMHRIYNKLGVQNRTQAAIAVFKGSLGSLL